MGAVSVSFYCGAVPFFLSEVRAFHLYEVPGESVVSETVVLVPVYLRSVVFPDFTGGERWRHGVVTKTAERSASEKAPYRKPGALKHSVMPKGVECIVRTGGSKAAGMRKKRGYEILICPDSQDGGKNRYVLDSAGFFLHREHSRVGVLHLFLYQHTLLKITF